MSKLLIAAAFALLLAAPAVAADTSTDGDGEDDVCFASPPVPNEPAWCAEVRDFEKKHAGQ